MGWAERRVEGGWVGLGGCVGPRAGGRVRVWWEEGGHEEDGPMWR
jgi:hypothetical protein